MGSVLHMLCPRYSGSLPLLLICPLQTMGNHFFKKILTRTKDAIAMYKDVLEIKLYNSFWLALVSGHMLFLIVFRAVSQTEGERKEK